MIRILLSRKLGELRWTQADLANATGIRPATISTLYNEFSERVNLEHLALICEALECDLTDILVYEKNDELHVKFTASTITRGRAVKRKAKDS